MENSYKQELADAEADIKRVKGELKSLDGVLTGLSTKTRDFLKAFSGKSPQEMAKGIEKAKTSMDSMTKTINKQAKADTKLRIIREKGFDKYENKLKKEAATQAKVSAKKEAAYEAEFKAYEKSVNKQIAAEKKVKAAREKSISKQMTGQMKEYVNSIGKTNQGLRQMGNYYSELEAKTKKVANAENKAKAAREKSISKQISGQVKEYAQSIGKTNDELKKMGSYYKALEKSTAKDASNKNKAAKAAGNLGTAYERLIAKQKIAKSNLQNLVVAEKKNTKEIKRAQREYNKLSARVNKANAATSNFAKGGLGKMARGFRNLMGAFGLAGGLYIFADMAKQGFKLAKELDSINFAMKTVIKDSHELARTQAFLADITERYGAAVVTTTERYNKFLAAAKQSGVSLKDTEQIFGSMTKAAGALGLKSDELTGIYLALEQMLSKGKVTTEELRRQLGERLPGAFGIMADAVGVTVSELDGMLRKGEIMSAEALPKFAKAVEKAYGIEQLQRVDNLNAATTRLSNAWVGLVKNITESGGAVSNSLISMIDYMTTLVGMFNTIESYDVWQGETRKMYDASAAAGDLANESTNLLKEYIKLKDKGITPTRNEKEKLEEIVLSLTDNFGKSVMSLNEETGAMELNIEKVLKQISVKRLLMDTEASELASRLKLAKVDKETSEIKKKELEDDIKIRERKVDAAERQKAAGERIIGDLVNSDSFTLYDEDVPSDLLKLEEAQNALKKVNEDIIEQDRRKQQLLNGLQRLGYSEEDIDRLFESSKARGEENENIEKANERLAHKEQLEENILALRKKFNETDIDDETSREAIGAGIKLLEDELKAWENNTDAKKKNNDVADETKVIMKGSSDAIKKVISETEDERDRLGTTTAERKKYNEEIEDQIRLLRILEEGREAQESVNEISSTEGISSTYEESLSDESQVRIDREIFFENKKQEAIDAIREGGLEHYKYLNDEQIASAERAAEIKEQLEEDLKDGIYDLGTNILEGRVERIDQEIDANKDKYAVILDNEELSEEQRSAIEAERDAKERKLEKEKRKREKEAFLFKQGIALAEIAINLAQTLSAIELARAGIVASYAGTGPIGVAVGAGLAVAYTATAIPLAIGTAALQAASVVAQTIPQFEKGTDNAKEGVAMVDEKRPEVHTDKHDNIKSFGSDKGANLRMLAKGDKIYESHNDYFDNIGEGNMQKAIFNMNMQSNGETLSDKQVDNALLTELSGLRNSNDRVWKEVKKLASRPIDNHLTINNRDNSAY